MNLILRYGALLALAGLAGCGSLFSSDNAPKPADEPEFELQVRLDSVLQFSVDSAGWRQFEPAVTDGLVHAVGQDGKLRAEAGDGRSMQLELSGGLTAGVAVSGEQLLVAGQDGRVISYGRDGRQRWLYQAGAQVMSRPQLVGDTVFVRSADGRVLALSAADGALRWQSEVKNPALTLHVPPAVTVSEERVYAGFADGRLRALRRDNGAMQWEVWVSRAKGGNELERMADVVGAPWLDGDQQICAVSFQGKIGCYELLRGEARWSRDFSSATGLDGDHRQVYSTDVSGVVVAFDKFSGQPVWKQDALFARQVTRPTVFGRFVAVADMDGVVYLLDAGTGKFMSKYDAGGAVRAPLQVVNESLLVQDVRGDVTLLRLR